MKRKGKPKATTVVNNHAVNYVVGSSERSEERETLTTVASRMRRDYEGRSLSELMDAATEAKMRAAKTIGMHGNRFVCRIVVHGAGASYEEVGPADDVDAIYKRALVRALAWHSTLEWLARHMTPEEASAVRAAFERA